MLDTIKKRELLFVYWFCARAFLPHLARLAQVYGSAQSENLGVFFFFSQVFSKHVSWSGTMHKFLNFPILILILSDLISQGNSPFFCCSVLGGLLFALSIIFCHRHKRLLVQLSIFLSKAYPLTSNKAITR